MHFLHFVFLLQDMWREWEKYKVALEASRSPEFMLICEKWQQLKFISREEMARSLLPFLLSHPSHAHVIHDVIRINVL